MGFYEEMQERGLIAQTTHEQELVEHLKQPRTGYIGFDPTADSLHVGHLLPIVTLARWQRAGHRAIALMGGGTALIGDPSGKTDMRKMLTEEDIDHRIERFKTQVSGLLDLTDSDRGITLNNADWLKPLQYLPFLRDIGVHFSVNRMLTAECFKQRLAKGLSFLEFNYMLLQSYDFLHLFREHRCTVQLGGDDQWSNILSGMELVRRLTRKQAFGITTPLLTTNEGKKMGKTEKGAVWLDPKLTSPYEFFQFWRNVPDELAGPCLRYFTFLDMTEVSRLEALQGHEINAAKVSLAFEVTKLVHGEKSAEEAKKTAEGLFSGGAGSGNEPIHTISREQFGEAMNIVQLLVVSGIVSTKAEAKRLVKQGGIALDGGKIADIAAEIPISKLDSQEGCVLKKGKKYYYRLRISP